MSVLNDIGLGYLRWAQPATETGGEARRVKLATELQRAQRGNTLYVWTNRPSGLHPADADRLMRHLQGWSMPATRGDRGRDMTTG